MKQYLLLTSIIYSSLFVFGQIPTGGGEVLTKSADCISDKERDSIFEIANQNAIRLSLNSLPVNSKTSIVAFDWPLEKDISLTDPGYYAISNYVDQNTASSQVKDYNCGAITYDGHKGTDIVLWPFNYDKMNSNLVKVIAAQAGTITYWHDGEFDMNCTSNSNPANAIIVQHVDGSVALYWHMKKNSLTAKGVGSTVSKGEFLGIVGSSGKSSDPHLHFEVYTTASKTNLIDPFSGTCNLLNGTTSWWAGQLPYYDAKLDKIMTGSAVPVVKWGCPANGSVSYEKKTFSPGEIVYFSAFYHLERLADNTAFKVYRPDGSVWKTWSRTSASDYDYPTFWCWNYTLPANAPMGKWKFEAMYKTQTVTTDFYVGITAVTNETIPGAEFYIYTDPAGRELTIVAGNGQKNESEICIIDLLGRRIFSDKIVVPDSTIKVINLPSDMAAGIYTIVISGREEGSIIKKFMKRQE
ncbi:MAG: peptidoglycan DD-metalloendopeptidase family protein [Bacteroidetes bacterium]|nr:peptidoglycan DD-metalloendopeptidase family protein [Bacteroidota bacterium]